MNGKPSSLYKRGKLWYVQFKTTDNHFSSGKNTKQTNMMLKDGRLIRKYEE
jgi:hypothetical protein